MKPSRPTYARWILPGLLTPGLHLVGEKWKQGTFSVPDEHRFTSICERAFELVKEKMLGISGITRDTRSIEALVTNSYGNAHTLGIRIVDRHSFIGSPPDTPDDDLLQIIEQIQPRYLLIPIALAQQLPSVMSIVESAQRSSSITKIVDVLDLLEILQSKS